MKIIAAIPSLKERTADLCRDLIARQVDEVHVVEGLGRWEAIYKCWGLGLQADILVLLPSDMLVYPNIVSQLISRLNGYDRVSAECRSKFRGMGSGGVSIYNTKCIPRLMRISKNVYRNSIRPESEPVVRHFKYMVAGIHTGLHEYELDYKEIYDRYLYQKIKHPSQTKGKLDLFIEKAKQDDDWKAALMAIRNEPFSMGTKPELNAKEIIQKYALG